MPAQPRTVLVTCLYALAAGAAAVAFQWSVNFIFNSTYNRMSGWSKPGFLAGSFLVIMGSAAAVGWLLQKFSPEAAGSGIPQLKTAYWKDFGFVPWRAVWVKFVAGAISLGGGSSLGREGPSVHFCGGIGSTLGGLLGEPKQKRRRAAAAGAAAGLAAAFNTPLAAVTFVLEEIIEDFNSRFLGSILLASVIGAMVVHALIGRQPAFALKNVASPSWLGYLLIPLISTCASLVGILFQKASLDLRAKKTWPFAAPPWSRPLMGAFVTWVLGSFVFLASGHLGVFSLGYDDLSEALAHKIAWQLGFVLLSAKLLSTIACYGFGGCGGIFSPTLFLGGMTSAALSGLLATALPIAPGDHVALAVVGMSSCLGAVVGAPVTGILIVFEMTHEFSLVPALMLGALFSQAARKALSPHNFYEAVLLQDGHNLDTMIPPRDLKDWQQLPISAIANFKPFIIPEPAAERLQEALLQKPFSRFPLCAPDGYKIVFRNEMEAALKSGSIPPMQAAATASPSQSIRELQHLLLNAPGSIILLVDSGAVLGIVTLHDLLRAQLSFAESKE